MPANTLHGGGRRMSVYRFFINLIARVSSPISLSPTLEARWNAERELFCCTYNSINFVPASAVSLNFSKSINMSRITPFSAIGPDRRPAAAPAERLTTHNTISFELDSRITRYTAAKGKREGKKWNKSSLRIQRVAAALNCAAIKNSTHTQDGGEEGKKYRKQNYQQFRLSIKTTYSYQFNWFFRSILLRYNNINGSVREWMGKR